MDYLFVQESSPWCSASHGAGKPSEIIKKSRKKISRLMMIITHDDCHCQKCLTIESGSLPGCCPESWEMEVTVNWLFSWVINQWLEFEAKLGLILKIDRYQNHLSPAHSPVKPIDWIWIKTHVLVTKIYQNKSFANCNPSCGTNILNFISNTTYLCDQNI